MNDASPQFPHDSQPMTDAEAFEQEMHRRMEGATATELAILSMHGEAADVRAFAKARLERIIAETPVYECGGCGRGLVVNDGDVCSRCAEDGR